MRREREEAQTEGKGETRDKERRVKEGRTSKEACGERGPWGGGGLKSAQ